MTPRATVSPRSSTGPISDTALPSSKEEQEIDFPPTPELGMSPYTPKTPGFIFPDTPTGDNAGFQALASKNIEGKDNTLNYGEMKEGGKALDPTTVFVGGLEMFGPAAWNEEKVYDFFAKFGAVDHVKFVRPGQFLSFPKADGY
jgi:hypothetical protein